MFDLSCSQRFPHPSGQRWAQRTEGLGSSYPRDRLRFWQPVYRYHGEGVCSLLWICTRPCLCRRALHVTAPISHHFSCVQRLTQEFSPPHDAIQPTFYYRLIFAHTSNRFYIVLRITTIVYMPHFFLYICCDVVERRAEWVTDDDSCQRLPMTIYHARMKSGCQHTLPTYPVCWQGDNGEQPPKPDSCEALQSKCGAASPVLRCRFPSALLMKRQVR
jgi:hypothetical protein